jgi:cell division transport system ATP-binding protein
MSLVKFSSVGLRYSTGPEVLHDINFELKQGSFHFLTGPSGAGKTSLLKLLYLGQRPTRGIINMFGKDVMTLPRDKMPALRRQVGVVFQDFRLLPHLSAFDNVALPLRIAGFGEDLVKKGVTELLEWVGLGDKMNYRPPTLSGGEQQRVAVARAVISRPKLVLADEPTGNIDQDIGLKLLHLFEELNKHGTTVLIATHDEDIVKRFNYPQLRLENGLLTPHDAPKQKTLAGAA